MLEERLAEEYRQGATNVLEIVHLRGEIGAQRQAIALLRAERDASAAQPVPPSAADEPTWQGVALPHSVPGDIVRAVDDVASRSGAPVQMYKAGEHFDMLGSPIEPILVVPGDVRLTVPRDYAVYPQDAQVFDAQGNPLAPSLTVEPPAGVQYPHLSESGPDTSVTVPVEVVPDGQRGPGSARPEPADGSLQLDTSGRPGASVVLPVEQEPTTPAGPSGEAPPDEGSHSGSDASGDMGTFDWSEADRPRLEASIPKDEAALAEAERALQGELRKGPLDIDPEEIRRLQEVILRLRGSIDATRAILEFLDSLPSHGPEGSRDGGQPGQGHAGIADPEVQPVKGASPQVEGDAIRYGPLSPVDLPPFAMPLGPRPPRPPAAAPTPEQTPEPPARGAATESPAMVVLPAQVGERAEGGASQMGSPRALMLPSRAMPSDTHRCSPPTAHCKRRRPPRSQPRCLSSPPRTAPWRSVRASTGGPGQRARDRANRGRCGSLRAALSRRWPDASAARRPAA